MDLKYILINGLNDAQENVSFFFFIRKTISDVLKLNHVNVNG